MSKHTDLPKTHQLVCDQPRVQPVSTGSAFKRTLNHRIPATGERAPGHSHKGGWTAAEPGRDPGPLGIFLMNNGGYTGRDDGDVHQEGALGFLTR